VLSDRLTDRFAAVGAHRCLVITDPPSGLRAFLVLDDLTLGPAAGGVRTARYASEDAALADAARLARAMSLKCSIAGLDAGGGKCVVIDHDGLDRPRAFRVLGEHVEDLAGRFRTGPDLGTTAEDVAAMASASQYVHLPSPALADAIGRGVRRGVEACAGLRQRRVDSLRAVVQGCGAMGAAVARALAEAGVALQLADVDRSRAEALATELGASVVDPSEALAADVDLLAPCAVGGVLTLDAVKRMRAWAVCGAANNQLAHPEVGLRLAERGILHVPDFVASAGAVIEGIGATVMGLADRSALVDRLEEVAHLVLTLAQRTERSATAVAEELALARMSEARAARSPGG
jgi:leucine dehydrogenase